MLKFIEGGIYHIQNAGCGGQNIFFTEANYSYFIGKIMRHIRPYAEILMYKLESNNIDLIIRVKHLSLFIASKNRERTLAKSIGLALRSYAQAINNQEKRKGVLWQGPTEAKLIGLCEIKEEAPANSLEEVLSSNDYKIDEEHYNLSIPNISLPQSTKKLPPLEHKMIDTLKKQLQKLRDFFLKISAVFLLLLASFTLFIYSTRKTKEQIASKNEYSENSLYLSTNLEKAHPNHSPFIRCFNT